MNLEDASRPVGSLDTERSERLQAVVVRCRPDAADAAQKSDGLHCVGENGTQMIN